MALEGRRHTGTARSFNGCWTCRLRRKKCDERRPVCETCAALRLTCHSGPEKPGWMDGGPRQDHMAARFRQEVRDHAHLRREGRVAGLPGDDVGPAAPQASTTTPGGHGENNGARQCPRVSTTPGGGTGCALISREMRQGSARFGPSDTVLMMFYLERVQPFLFPFYRPPAARGGRAWLLEMMLNSPVVRQAMLCLSPYFFSLTQGGGGGGGSTADDNNNNNDNNNNALWETVLAQTGDAFATLARALQVVSDDDAGVGGHLHGATRILAGILQLQRFEGAVLSFGNCRAHHGAALALFEQILDSAGPGGATGPRARFDVILGRLGSPSSSSLPAAQFPRVESAERAAFLFSTALLLHDDVVASTALREPPRLHEYHDGLLGDADGTGPSVDLEAVVGCQNWAFLRIGEIAALDAWKRQRKTAGDLDVMELVRRAARVKCALEAGLARLEAEPGAAAAAPADDGGLFDILAGEDAGARPGAAKDQTSTATRVWAHAALLYLCVVVSGWQPASPEVRHHVSRVAELLSDHLAQPSLLRTMTWPFGVAGCLAEAAQEPRFRALAERLRPPSVFGTVYKALEMMEGVWRGRDAEGTATRDLATCFRSQGDIILLV
ncbi:putative Zn2 Cys6 DNA-binding protein [Rosellinia necatrix]|uniref:Putative Zn2 Cys6 DNA-binding protein n=1 Tax=Rosellinia necatrix TaxID=77044 RepID=A0A1W2TCF2_ROSNE|nr:putative Zn2 Cys6 DNA-binding protein [Rosellinia necatrix]